MQQQPPYDLLLQGGHVIDPANNLDGPADIALKQGRIAQVASNIAPHLAETVVDVRGLVVTPGLIDIHMHAYYTREPEGIGVMPDFHSFRSGVTTVVDTGTAGANHFLHFKRTVIDLAKTRVLAYINIVRSGMIGPFEQDIREMDPELAASIVLANPETCVGIKTAHYWTRLPFDAEHPPWAAVERAVQAGELCNKPVMVDFWPRPERPYEDLVLKKMRPGDIHTHVYAQQFPLLDENRKPRPFLAEARKRGIIFDVGHGAASFWYRQALPAIEGGFGPDSISTDLHTGNVNGPVVDMLTTMSKFLHMGLPLQEVIYRSTVTPAREIGRPELGTLSVGAEADVAVLQLCEGEFPLVDCGKAKLIGTRRLECRMTLRAGRIVYNPDGLALPEWTDAPAEYWTIRQSATAP
ncbi:MAG TPA: amidohydrolase/deacetylase family metallohydrolase [Chthonomonadaceae bacterium]|nr:amidohydrolase/deacetylase family metallohydrolase [Chthonomonadaceae bacterium]